MAAENHRGTAAGPGVGRAGMNRQRGFALPTWAIYALAAAAALGALWYAYTTIDGRGYARGKAETESRYQTRDNKALQDALARVQALQAEVRAREAQHQAAIDQIEAKRKQEAQDAKRQRDRDVAAARDGALKLRDPGAAAGTAHCDRSPGPAPGTAAAGSDDRAPGELSGAAAEFLLSLVHDADDVARQLGAAQQVIRAQIRACNGP